MKAKHLRFIPALCAFMLSGQLQAEATAPLSLLDWFAPAQQAQLQASVANSAVLAELYQQQEYRLFWQDAAQAQELLGFINASVDDGLNPEDYHATKLRELLAANDTATMVERDLLLTDAYLLLANNLLFGRMEPSKLDRQWQRSKEELDVSAYLLKALTDHRIASSLADLYPQHLGYQELKAQLPQVRHWITQGGWPSVDSSKKLTSGMRNPAVAQLRARLQVTDAQLLAVKPEQADLFDAELKKAVQRFQADQGLEADGVTGKSTFTALNMTAEQRLEQIWANLERLRWLPQNLGPRYIMANIADFRLKVVDEGQTALVKKVIVGNIKRPNANYERPYDLYGGKPIMGSAS
jgi:murein L,D-transpeptidase YcbB/YkuD